MKGRSPGYDGGFCTRNLEAVARNREGTGTIGPGRARETVWVPVPGMTDGETEASKAEALSRAGRTVEIILSEPFL